MRRISGMLATAAWLAVGWLGLALIPSVAADEKQPDAVKTETRQARRRMVDGLRRDRRPTDAGDVRQNRQAHRQGR